MAADGDVGGDSGAEDDAVCGSDGFRGDGDGSGALEGDAGDGVEDHENGAGNDAGDVVGKFAPSSSPLDCPYESGVGPSESHAGPVAASAASKENGDFDT